MIYVTGDCHGEFIRFNKKYFPEQKEMSKEDFVIICGDFGGVWNKDYESKYETVQLDWLESQSFTTLFVSGNHENYDRLDAYPVEEWKGGKIQRIRPSIIHLMRGQVYTIDGKRLSTKLEQGVDSGTNIRFANKGLPIYGTNRFGHMIGVVKTIIPKKLNNREKDLLRQLQEEEHFKE